MSENNQKEDWLYTPEMLDFIVEEVRQAMTREIDLLEIRLTRHISDELQASTNRMQRCIPDMTQASETRMQRYIAHENANPQYRQEMSENSPYTQRNSNFEDFTRDTQLGQRVSHNHSNNAQNDYVPLSMHRLNSNSGRMYRNFDNNDSQYPILNNDSLTRNQLNSFDNSENHIQSSQPRFEDSKQENLFKKKRIEK